MKLPIGEPKAVGQFIMLTNEWTTAIAVTIAAGWERAVQCAAVHPDADEVTMTECLRDGMREAMRVSDLPWKKVLAVLPGTESRSTPDTLLPDGRTDIPIFLTLVFAQSGQHDPHAIIECKRVSATDAYLAREYVSEGIDRFSSGKYAANHHHGFMIGYVLTGAAAQVIARVNGYLAKLGRVAEQLAPTSASAPPLTWNSQHPRHSGVPIDLHHTMVAVPGVSPTGTQNNATSVITP